MSSWTYINGIVTVSPMGRTQEEKEYILKTALNHLPLITGSEEDAFIKIMEKESGCSSWRSHDEFDRRTNNLTDSYGQKSRNRGHLVINEDYLIIINGSLRDRYFIETYKEFIKWITRLAKRVDVRDVLVQINDYYKSEIITNKELNSPRRYETQFGQMFEDPTWCNKESTEPNWCEYLMWDRGKNTSLPMMLEYKYYNNEENDTEVERRLNFQ